MYIVIIHLCLFLCKVNNRNKKIDKGKFLQEMAEKSGVSIINLVKKAGYKHRASYYMHISKPDLSFEILKKYATALKIDLRLEFPEAADFEIEDNSNLYSITPKTLNEAIENIKFWKEKYYSLLEKYTRKIERDNN